MVGMVMLMTMALLGRSEFSPYSTTPYCSTRHDRRSFDAAAVADDTSSLGGQSKKKTRLEAPPNRAHTQSYTGKDGSNH